MADRDDLTDVVCASGQDGGNASADGSEAGIKCPYEGPPLVDPATFGEDSLRQQLRLPESSFVLLDVQ